MVGRRKKIERKARGDCVSVGRVEEREKRERTPYPKVNLPARTSKNLGAIFLTTPTF